MYDYYTAVCIVSWLGLAILCILVNENGRIPKKSKRVYYFTYVLIAAAQLAEWLAIRLNGNTDIPIAAIGALKCADFILTPVACGMFALQLRMRNGASRVLVGLLIFNAAAQIPLAFTDLMIKIDPVTHSFIDPQTNKELSGSLYPAYIALGGVILVIVIIQFVIYGRTFRRRNHASLYSIMFLVIAGTTMQELVPKDLSQKVFYLSLTLGAALMFIHLMEYAQLSADDTLTKQQKEIITDDLTGMYNRRAYSNKINTFDPEKPLPSNLAVFSLDINGLKNVNDMMGHEAGDELICGAADCIRKMLGDNGECYRTGGDEFIAFSKMNRKQADAALERLNMATDVWIGKIVREVRISAGYALASDHPGMTIEKLICEADKKMYARKSTFYRERRKNDFSGI
ncbi:MAG: GGDEF domain-containing protein [Clostridia bacterium]|nr:GGDEF domain-containing protein [Clostridia bacterium]